MAKRLTTITIIYGAAFCIAIPALLVAWSWALDRHFASDGFHSPVIGMAVVILGTGMMVAAWHALIRHGDGLPMNAAPPQNWVTRGVFRVLPHPIYTGFSLICIGVSVWTGAFAAQAIISPIVVLGCLALWWGFERTATIARLGPRPISPYLSLASDTTDAPKFSDLVSTWAIIFVPWAALYEGIGHLPVPGAIDTWLTFERTAAVHTWTEYAYILAYPLVAFTPLLCKDRRTLRQFQSAAIIASVLGFWCYLCFPALTPPRPFAGDDLAARLLRFERADGLDGRAALPSFHVCWAILCAWVIARRSTLYRMTVWPLAIAICLATWTTGMHGVVDILAGIFLAVVAINATPIWLFLLRCAEANANGWHEWRVGRFRILGYALWPAIAAAVGWIMIDTLTGAELRLPIACIALGGLVGAGAWGQWLEASSKLARPFGYYGHLLGSLAGAGIAALLIRDLGTTLTLLAALATAAPWVQAIGRIRCLTQGCCHGRATRGSGLVYHSPRSRVLKFSTLGHTPIHATQVYSILGNVAIGALFIRAYSAGVPTTLVAGGYLILSGLLRFVEEHYRGEPQTRLVAKLPIYQWLSLACVVAGIAITFLPAPPLQASVAHADMTTALAAGVIAILYAIAMGVDVPDSQRRFGRLA